MSKPVQMGGPIAWSLILREHQADPARAMRLLRVAGCGARTRAALAVDTWRTQGPEKVIEALATVRSAAAVAFALNRMGWDEETPDPTGKIAQLRLMAGQGRDE